ncbi:FAD-binding oxidoreductase [Actinocatenispora rupis]|uniref:Oxidoreductase n=1 Tax=Actinocatenispora rupis TaxID=519421 RepID=A0A8J3J7C4_9ACTN|nr:FAD-binding oxidoreductase [Actinocatenispora rupis]GID11424.1 oxidoreductase [Actinocatenispora rupis]
MNDMATLLSDVDGEVLVPGDDGYDTVGTGFQLRDPHRPDAVVRATCPADVQAAVRVAAERRLPVAVQATGHGRAAGLDGGLLVATGRMDTVRVDPDRRYAEVAAGATWQQVVDATTPYGLAPLSGSFPKLGAVPYTLGGGIGLLSRRYGFAADHVRAVQVVTPDGRLRHVDPDTEPDLYWGLRGGGGNLGIATSMRIGLLPVDRIHGGALSFDAERDPHVAAGWWRWTRDLPEGMTSAYGMVPYPDLPMFPPELRGRVISRVQVCWSGPADEFASLVAPLRRLGTCLADTLRELPYRESGSVFAEPDRAHPYRSSVVLLPDLDEAGLADLHTATVATRSTVVGIRHLGGAMGRPAAVPNAVGHRDAGYLVSVLSAGESVTSAELTGLLGGWPARSLGRSLNFSFGPLTPDQVREGFDPADARRLGELRAAYDPDGLLRPNHPVPTP